MEEQRKYIDIGELVVRSGMSESTIRRRVRDGSLHAVQLGGKGKKLLFSVDVLDRVNTPMTSAEDNASVEPIILSPSGTQADDSAGSHPRWMRKLNRRPRPRY